MFKSMTGFGKAIAENQTVKITVEIKSVNSKSFDLMLKIPAAYKEKESEIRSEISKLLERGKIECIISSDSLQSAKQSVINEVVFENYYNQFNTLQHKFKLENTDLLSLIMRMPDVLKNSDQEVDENEYKLVFKALASSLEKIDSFRIQEGKALETDILSHLTEIEIALEHIPPFEEERVQTTRSRILQNLTDLMGDKNFDKNRFEQELIYYLEKFDINEEKARLRNHCIYFRETAGQIAQGRKLGFITQEIGREINTIGSKANHAEIQKIVVKMKDELEKIKEQLMNVL